MTKDDLFTLPNAFYGVILALTPIALPAIGAPSWLVLFHCLFLLLWFLALVLPLEKSRHAKTLTLLKSEHFKHLYRLTIGKRLLRLWRRYCDPVPKSAGFVQTFRAALTWRLYDLALLIAVVYPIFAAMGVWLLFDIPGRLGATPVFSGPFWPHRFTVLLSLFFWAWFAFGQISLTFDKIRSLSLPNKSLLSIVALLISTLVFFVPIVFAGPGVLASLLALMFAYTSRGKGGGVAALTLSSAAAFAFPFAGGTESYLGELKGPIVMLIFLLGLYALFVGDNAKKHFLDAPCCDRFPSGIVDYFFKI